MPGDVREADAQPTGLHGIARTITRIGKTYLNYFVRR